MINLQSLRNKKIIDHYAEYQEIVESSTTTSRIPILKTILQSDEINYEMLTIIQLLVKKCDSSEKEFFYFVVYSITQPIKDKKSCSNENLTLMIQIFFSIFDLIKKLNESEKSKILSNFRLLIQEAEKSADSNLSELLTSSFLALLSGLDSADLCVAIFNLFLQDQILASEKSKEKKDFSVIAYKSIDAIFESIKSDTTPNLIKNISIFLNEIAARCTEIFIDKDFIDHENHQIRSSYIEIYFHLILLLKSSNEDKLKSEDTGSALFTLLNDYLDLIIERLLDVSHYVRAKAITALTHLLQKQAILISNREKVLNFVIERLRDKNVLVRKRAIQFCHIALENHPFANNKYLTKIDVKKMKENLENESQNIDGDKEKYNKQKLAYVEDLNLFVDMMVSVLNTIMEIFPSLRTETVDIIEFTRTCIVLKLPKSTEFLNFLCKNIDKKHKTVLVEVLIELVNDLKKTDENNLVELFLAIDDTYLKILSQKNIIEKKFLKSLMKQFEQKTNIVKVSFLLKRACSRRFNGDYFETAINYVKNEESPTTIAAYKNILEIVKLKPFEGEKKTQKSPELANPSTVSDYTKAIDILINTKIIDFELIDLTVRLIYRTVDPHFYIKELLQKLVESKSITKLVYCVGSIALNESFFIDKMEKNIPAILVPDEIKERRKSFNVSRNSFRNSINESLNNRNSFIYGDESFNDSYVQPVTVIKSQTGLENKSDEEIKDILFFIKEKEIFYGKNSLLAPFIKLVLQNTQGPLEIPSCISVFRMMTVSSEFFVKNHTIFLKCLRSKNRTILYNALVALADYILLYNCYTEKYTSLLFDKLFVSEEILGTENDENGEISEIKAQEIVNLTLFIINYLISSKILKIKGYGAILCRLYDTHTEELKSLLQEIKSDENAISSVFYEVLLEELNNCTQLTTKEAENVKKVKEGSIRSLNVILFLKDLVREKTKENLFIKILKKYYGDDKYERILNILYKNLTFNQKNISNMRVDSDFSKFIESK